MQRTLLGVERDGRPCHCGGGLLAPFCCLGLLVGQLRSQESHLPLCALCRLQLRLKARHLGDECRGLLFRVHQDLRCGLVALLQGFTCLVQLSLPVKGSLFGFLASPLEFLRRAKCVCAVAGGLGQLLLQLAQFVGDIHGQIAQAFFLQHLQAGLELCNLRIEVYHTPLLGVQVRLHLRMGLCVFLRHGAHGLVGLCSLSLQRRSTRAR
jgi:hypothetical protein